MLLHVGKSNLISVSPSKGNFIILLLTEQICIKLEAAFLQFILWHNFYLELDYHQVPAPWCMRNHVQLSKNTMYVSSNTDYLKFKHADLEKKIRQTENLTPQKEINNL